MQVNIQASCLAAPESCTRRKAIALVLGVCMVVSQLCSGCGERPATPATSTKRVVTTFTILADMAQNVAGDAAIIESITKPGAEIHDYEPTPRDIVKAQSADLVLINGMGLERWFERFMQNVKDVPAAVLSDGVEPIGIGSGPYSGKPNPHAWMSPANALVYVENIKVALTRLDPANGPKFAANAAAYSEQIRRIDTRLREQLARVPAQQRWLVSSEAAFSYLARDAGMKELSLWPVNADEEGTPQQIKAVVDAVRSNQIPVCFSESTISDKPMRQVCNETGARFGGTLYVDSLTAPDGEAPTYLKLLEFNANQILKGFAIETAPSASGTP